MYDVGSNTYNIYTKPQINNTNGELNYENKYKIFKSGNFTYDVIEGKITRFKSLNKLNDKIHN